MDPAGRQPWPRIFTIFDLLPFSLDSLREGLLLKGGRPEGEAFPFGLSVPEVFRVPSSTKVIKGTGYLITFKGDHLMIPLKS